MIEITVNGKQYKVFMQHGRITAQNPSQQVTTCIIIGAGGAFTGTTVQSPDDFDNSLLAERLAFKRAALEVARFWVGDRLRTYGEARELFENIQDEAFRAYRLALKEPDELVQAIETSEGHRFEANQRRAAKLAQKQANIARQKEIQEKAKERRRKETTHGMPLVVGPATRTNRLSISKMMRSRLTWTSARNNPRQPPAKRKDSMDIDKCFYCGLEYHPMMKFTKRRNAPSNNLPYQIQACDMTFVFINGDLERIDTGSRCMNRAYLDGYEKRPDLTPKR